MILLDANILLRLAQKTHPLYITTRNCVLFHRTRAKLIVCPQSFYEFWAVATRNTTSNGLAMDMKRVSRWMLRFSTLFDFVPEYPETKNVWAKLVADYAITGIPAHDVRYVALMQLSGITQFMTFNAKHFSRFPITIIDPEAGIAAN